MSSVQTGPIKDKSGFLEGPGPLFAGQSAPSYVPTMIDMESIERRLHGRLKFGEQLLVPEQERDFEKWYADLAAKTKIDQNPDNPLHYYDYRKAYTSGAEPQQDAETGEWHWPSEYKRPGHPRTVVDGKNTITGETVAPVDYTGPGPGFDPRLDNKTEIDPLEILTSARAAKRMGIEPTDQVLEGIINARARSRNLERTHAVDAKAIAEFRRAHPALTNGRSDAEVASSVRFGRAIGPLPELRGIGEQVGRIGAGAFRAAFMDAPASISDAVASLFDAAGNTAGARFWRQAAENNRTGARMPDWMAETLQRPEDYAAADFVGEAFGMVLPSAAVVRGPALAKWGVYAYYGIQAVGGGSEAYRKGLEDKGLTPQAIDALIVGVGSGIVEMVSERLGLETIGRIGADVAKQWGDLMLRGRYRDLARLIATTEGIANVEAVEELIAQIGQNAIARNWEPNGPGSGPDRGYFEGAMEAYGMGLIGGHVLAFPAAFKASQQPSRAERAEDLAAARVAARLLMGPVEPGMARPTAKGPAKFSERFPGERIEGAEGIPGVLVFNTPDALSSLTSAERAEAAASLRAALTTGLHQETGEPLTDAQRTQVEVLLRGLESEVWLPFQIGPTTQTDDVLNAAVTEPSLRQATIDAGTDGTADRWRGEVREARRRGDDPTPVFDSMVLELRQRADEMQAPPEEPELGAEGEARLAGALQPARGGAFPPIPGAAEARAAAEADPRQRWTHKQLRALADSLGVPPTPKGWNPLTRSWETEDRTLLLIDIHAAEARARELGIEPGTAITPPDIAGRLRAKYGPPPRPPGEPPEGDEGDGGEGGTPPLPSSPAEVLALVTAAADAAGIDVTLRRNQLALARMATEVAQSGDFTSVTDRIARLKQADVEFAALERRTAERQSRIDAFVAANDGRGFQAPRTDQPGHFVVVHPSTSPTEAGRWQLTRFDPRGPVGHNTYATYAEAVSEAVVHMDADLERAQLGPVLTQGVPRGKGKTKARGRRFKAAPPGFGARVTRAEAKREVAALIEERGLTGGPIQQINDLLAGFSQAGLTAQTGGGGFDPFAGRPYLGVDSFTLTPDQVNDLSPIKKAQLKRRFGHFSEEAETIKDFVGEALYEAAVDQALGTKTEDVQKQLDSIIESAANEDPRVVLLALIDASWSPQFSDLRWVDAANLKPGQGFTIVGEKFEVGEGFITWLDREIEFKTAENDEAPWLTQVPIDTGSIVEGATEARVAREAEAAAAAAAEDAARRDELATSPRPPEPAAPPSYLAEAIDRQKRGLDPGMVYGALTLMNPAQQSEALEWAHSMVRVAGGRNLAIIQRAVEEYVRQKAKFEEWQAAQAEGGTGEQGNFVGGKWQMGKSALDVAMDKEAAARRAQLAADHSDDLPFDVINPAPTEEPVVELAGEQGEAPAEQGAAPGPADSGRGGGVPEPSAAGGEPTVAGAVRGGGAAAGAGGAGLAGAAPVRAGTPEGTDGGAAAPGGILSRLSPERQAEISAARADAASILKDLRGKVSLIAGVDPAAFARLVDAGVTIGLGYVEAGVLKIADFAKALMPDFSSLGPHLPNFIREVYMKILGEPGVNIAGMDRMEAVAKMNDEAILKFMGRPALVTAGEARVPTPREIVTADTYPLGQLADDQRLAANLALDTFFSGRGTGFMLADGTGVGKTRTQLAIADQYRKQHPGQRILIVTENKNIIEGNFRPDAAKMGIDLTGIEFGTYKGVSLGTAGRGQYGLVVFDEAHNFKNADSLKTIIGKDIKAFRKVFATATPLDRPVSATYFMSQITGLSEEQIARQLGYQLQTVTTNSGKVIEIPQTLQGVNWPQVMQNLVAMRDKAVGQGRMIRREYPFYGTISTEAVELESRFHDEEPVIWDYYQDLIDAAQSPFMRARWAGVRTHELSRLSEGRKLEAVKTKILSELAEGRSVIVMAEGIEKPKLQSLGDHNVPGMLNALAAWLEAGGAGGVTAGPVQTWQQTRAQAVGEFNPPYSVAEIQAAEKSTKGRRARHERQTGAFVPPPIRAEVEGKLAASEATVDEMRAAYRAYSEDFKQRSIAHHDAVEAAARAGQPVPAEVLADYPQIKVPTAKGKKPKKVLHYAKIFGSGNKAKEVDRFQSGQVQIALVTPGSGGVGINLDDVVGNKPRTMLITTANFSGNAVDQMIGRVSRRNTQSPSRVIFLKSGISWSDQRRSDTLTSKLQALRRIQAGEDLDVAYGFDSESIQGQRRSGLADKFNRIADSAQDRIKNRPRPSGRNRPGQRGGSAPIFLDIYDATIAIAARLAAKGVESYAKVRAAVEEFLKASRPDLLPWAGSISNNVRRLLLASRTPVGGVDEAGFNAVAEQMRTEAVRHQQNAGPTVKSRIWAMVTPGRPAPATVTEPAALQAAMRGQVIGSEAGARDAQRRADAQYRANLRKMKAEATLRDASLTILKRQLLDMSVEALGRSMPAGIASRIANLTTIHQFGQVVDELERVVEVRQKKAAIRRLRETLKSFNPRRLSQQFRDMVQSLTGNLIATKLSATAEEDIQTFAEVYAALPPELVFINKKAIADLKKLADARDPTKRTIDSLTADEANSIEAAVRHLVAIDKAMRKTIDQFGEHDIQETINKVRAELVRWRSARATGSKGTMPPRLAKVLSLPFSRLSNMKPDLMSEWISGTDNTDTHRILYDDFFRQRGLWLAGWQESQDFMKALIKAQGLSTNDLRKMSAQLARQIGLVRAAYAMAKRGGKGITRLNIESQETRAEIIKDPRDGKEGFLLESGERLMITQAERMYIMASMEDVDFIEAVVFKKARLRVFRGPAGSAQVVEGNDLLAIRRSATDVERVLVAEGVKYINGPLRDLMEQWSIDTKGFSIVSDDTHYPIHRDHPPDPAGVKRAPFAQQMMDTTGYAQERTGGDLPIQIRDFFTEFSNISWITTALVYMDQTVKMAHAVVNSPEVGTFMTDAYGKRMTDFWNRMLDQLAKDGIGGPTLHGDITDSLSRLTDSAQRGIIVANPFIAILQPLSYFTAGTDVPNLHLADPRALGAMWDIRPNGIMARMRESPWIRDRMEANSARLVSEASHPRHEFLGINEEGLLDRIIGWMDMPAIRGIWRACELWVDGDPAFKDQGPDVRRAEVHRRAHRAIFRSQAAFDTLHLSNQQMEGKQNRVASIFTRLRSQISQIQNQVYRSTLRMARSRDPMVWMREGKNILVVGLLGQMLYALIRELRRYLLKAIWGVEAERPLAERFTVDTIAAIASIFPFGEYAAYLLNRLAFPKSPIYDVDASFVAGLTEQMSRHVYGTLASIRDNDEKLWDNLLKALETGLIIYGKPMGNVLRYAHTIHDSITEEDKKKGKTRPQPALP